MSDVKKCPMFKCFDPEKFLLPNCSKIAEECDWNSKISQNVRNLFFFNIKKVFYLEKILDFFFKIGEGGIFAVACVSNDITS